MIRKRMLIAPLLAIVLLLTSCVPHMPRGVRITVDGWAEDIRDAVLEGIQDRDREKIKEQFSVQALADTEDIEKGIDYLFELVKGDITEVEDMTWSTGESIDYGKRQSEIRGWSDFTTTEGEYYLFLLANDRDDYNKDNIGLQSLRIVAIDDNYPKHVTYWQNMQQPGIYAPTEKEVRRTAAINTDEYARIFIERCKKSELFVSQVREYFNYQDIRDSFWFGLDCASVLYDEGALFAIVDVGIYPQYKANGEAAVEGGGRVVTAQVLFVADHTYALLYDPANAPRDAVLDAFRGMSTTDDAASWYEDDKTPTHEHQYGTLQSFYFGYGSEIYIEYELMSKGLFEEDDDSGVELLYVRENGQLLEGYPIEVKHTISRFDRVRRAYDLQKWQYEYAPEEMAADGDGFSIAMQYTKTYIRSFGYMAFPDEFEQAKAEILEDFEQIQRNAEAGIYDRPMIISSP